MPLQHPVWRPLSVSQHRWRLAYHRGAGTEGRPYRLTCKVRGFDHVPDDCQKLMPASAVNHSMIEAQAQQSRRANRYGVVDHDRALLDSADAKDRNLRLVDDRHSDQAAEHTGI